MSNSHPNMTSHPLNVAGLPLNGRHLIEASAGTGKTFNITRLYLRMLLEKRLSVQQILVMTFTNAATEEIRGRIADTLQEAADYWQHFILATQNHSDDDYFNETPTNDKDGTDSTSITLSKTPINNVEPFNGDPLFLALYKAFPGQPYLDIIKAALLELDEASVYTIHGFCNRVLGELAFTSGAAMKLALETDTRDNYLLAAQDWIRQIAADEDAYNLLVEAGWHTPQAIQKEFEAAIRSGLNPVVQSESEIAASYTSSVDKMGVQVTSQKKELIQQLSPYMSDIDAGLVSGVKDSTLRQEQWADILNWLHDDGYEEPPGALAKFLHGGRFRSKPELKALLEPLKVLAKQVKDTLSQLSADRDKAIEKLPVLKLITKGFMFISEHVAQQKRQQGIVDFDDLISMLADRVSAPDSRLAIQLREKYPAALIDEFQDTDANQYQILANIYAAPCQDQVLMMIGDPKQAIYGFRGGDIFTYLKAGKQADHRWVMDTNWRSVADMVNAYNRLFYGAPMSGEATDVFGYGIQYEPVNATNHAKANRAPLSDPLGDRAALTYAYVAPQEGAKPAKAQLQQDIAQWVSDEILRLLKQATLGDESLAPQDIAILVRSGPEAQVIQQALRKAGIASVFLSNRSNLFSAAEAHDLYRVLDGIWHMSDQYRLSAALSSPLFGFSHETLIQLLYKEDDTLWNEIIARVSALKLMWQERGAMAVILHMLEYQFQANSDGTERALTNYLHLAEVLERASSEQAHADQLLIWLHRQIANPDVAQEQTQRLESDARLIQIVTQHGSKGLEYPVVFVPFASIYRDPAKVGPQFIQLYRYFDEEAGGLVLQLGKNDAAVEKVRQEGEAEAMRLLYVAVTRAAQRCYLGVAPFDGSEKSSLAVAMGMSSGEQWEEVFSRIDSENNSHTRFVSIESGALQTRDRANIAEPEPLVAQDFNGNVNERWRLYSFSALARRQMTVNQTRRELEEEIPDTHANVSIDESPLPYRFTFEKGASAGNLLHDILELHDFSQPKWEEAGLDMAVRFGIDDDDIPGFFKWIEEVLQTPLLQTGLCLAQLHQTATLKEAEFYFPMTSVNFYKLDVLLKSHRQKLAQKHSVTLPVRNAESLEGLMHGFIDLIFEWEGKYYVADYKSTHLGSDFSDYLPEKLMNNNAYHLYDLQYLIYSLALHRYLSLQLPDYLPERHFGGVYYLYLRGMHPDNASENGVFFTQLETEELEALNDAFGLV